MRTIIAHPDLLHDYRDAIRAGESLFVLPRSLEKLPEFRNLQYEGEPALIMLTSGTTAKQKPVVIPWRAAEFRVSSVLRSFGEYMQRTVLLTGDERNYFYAREVMIAAGFQGEIVHDIKHATCAVVFGKGYTPFADKIRRAKDLKAIISCGFLMTNAMWHDLRDVTDAKIITRYGATEVGSISHTFGEEVKDGNIGKAFHGVQIATTTEPADGIATEIVVKTPGMATKYLGHDMPLNADGWYKTGDQGYHDPEGNLHIVNARRGGQRGQV